MEALQLASKSSARLRELVCLRRSAGQPFGSRAPAAAGVACRGRSGTVGWSPPRRGSRSWPPARCWVKLGREDGPPPRAAPRVPPLWTRPAARALCCLHEPCVPDASRRRPLGRGPGGPGRPAWRPLRPGPHHTVSCCFEIELIRSGRKANGQASASPVPHAVWHHHTIADSRLHQRSESIGYGLD